MKYLCRKCGKEVEHNCNGSFTGTTVVPCPHKGAVWVYVTDLDGAGVAGIKVSLRDGEHVTEKKTDDMGLAEFPSLDEGSKRVKIVDLGSREPEFYMPEQHSGSVSVTKGQTSLIEFHLPTWIEIRVEDEDGTLVEDQVINLVFPDGQSRALSKSDLKDDAYHAGAIVPGECQVSLAGLPDAEWTAR